MNSIFKSVWFVKQDNLVQFLKQRIFILNQKIPNNIFAPQLKTNYIYLTNNPKTALSEINNNFNYQTIIVDGSNNDHLITDISKQAAAKSINYTILKRNISLVSESN
jgi:competence protein ComEC